MSLLETIRHRQYNNIKRNNSTVDEVLERCRRDFMDLSDNSKEVFKPKYDLFLEELKKKLLGGANVYDTKN